MVRAQLKNACMLHSAHAVPYDHDRTTRDAGMIQVKKSSLPFIA